jgi:predicted Zn-dependent protease with MMP-like domain
MHPDERAWFDEQLEIVIDELPPLVQGLMEDTQLIVEDRPSRGFCRQVHLEFNEQLCKELCGFYLGISLDEELPMEEVLEVEDHPTTVYLFREGILNAAAEDDGTVFDDRLREEIRITILHEYGHHHGMDEDELEEKGYG